MSNNYTLDELTQKIAGWGVNRGILPNGDKSAQYYKTLEEVDELKIAIDEYDRVEAKDAIGDIFVTLVMQAECWGFTMEECVNQAWNEIKDRKGKMVNGQFLKAEDYDAL